MWSRGLVGIHFGFARFLRVFESHLGFVESLGSYLVDFFLVVHIRCLSFCLGQYVWQEAEVACQAESA